MPGKTEAAEGEMNELHNKVKFYKVLLRFSGFFALWYSLPLAGFLYAGMGQGGHKFEKMVFIFMLIAMLILGCLARLFYAMLEMQQLSWELTHERDVENRE